jgi:hypothetical protein
MVEELGITIHPNSSISSRWCGNYAFVGILVTARVKIRKSLFIVDLSKNRSEIFAL